VGPTPVAWIPLNRPQEKKKKKIAKFSLQIVRFFFHHEYFLNGSNYLMM